MNGVDGVVLVVIQITDDRAPNGRHLRVQHTYGWGRRLLLLDPARGRERLMEIQQHDGEGERDRKQKFSDLRTSPGPLWRLHTWFDLFRYRLVAQREVESMTIGGADPRS